MRKQLYLFVLVVAVVFTGIAAYAASPPDMSDQCVAKMVTNAALTSAAIAAPDVGLTQVAFTPASDSSTNVIGQVVAQQTQGATGLMKEAALSQPKWDLVLATMAVTSHFTTGAKAGPITSLEVWPTARDKPIALSGIWLASSSPPSTSWTELLTATTTAGTILPKSSELTIHLLRSTTTADSCATSNGAKLAGFSANIEQTKCGTTGTKSKTLIAATCLT